MFPVQWAFAAEYWLLSILILISLYCSENLLFWPERPRERVDLCELSQVPALLNKLISYSTKFQTINILLRSSCWLFTLDVDDTT